MSDLVDHSHTAPANLFDYGPLSDLLHIELHYISIQPAFVAADEEYIFIYDSGNLLAKLNQ